MPEKTKIILVIVALMAFVSLGAYIQHLLSAEHQNAEVAFEQSEKYIALDHYVSGFGTHRQEAWWWEWENSGRNQYSAISRWEMWRYRDIFNKYLPEKCERYEDWNDYYRKVVIPFLWQDVAFQHAPSNPPAEEVPAK